MGRRSEARWPRVGPVLALMVLAPVCVDMVLGATTVSTPFALVPEVLTYGVAAVLIREVARAGGRGPATVVILGAAFAVVSECLVVQTSLAPGAGADAGRALGVNWPYLVWAVGYEAVWAILLPIRLGEALFPGRAREPWLSRRARVGFGVLFALGCLVAWYQWTRVVRPRFLGLPVYEPPWPLLLMATLVAAGLVLLAVAVPAAGARWSDPAVRAPRPWLVGTVAVLATAAWFGLTVAAPPVLPPAVGSMAAVVVAVAVAIAVARWSRAPGWSGAQCLALIAGALLGSSGAGFVVVPLRSTTDLVGKIVIDVVVLGVVLWTASRRRRSPHPAGTPGH